MILILSDSSGAASEVEKQLDLYKDRYIRFFTDFRAAGTGGKGIVYVGAGTEDALAGAVGESRAEAIIDCIAEPAAKASAAAMAVCRRLDIRYVKYLNITDKPGLKLRLYYAEAANMVRQCNGSVLFYASPGTVRKIAEIAGRAATEKMYVPIEKMTEFDTNAALEYGVPLLNVVETEWSGGEEAVAEMIKRYDAQLVVCDNSVGIEDKAGASFKAGIPIVYTHSMGMEYDEAAATARDAVIAVHRR